MKRCLCTCISKAVARLLANQPDGEVRLVCVGADLFSREVALQVFSARLSLTTVFGMGTGGPSPLSAPTISFTGLPVNSFFRKSGDPCGNRTHVWGVRGPRLNLLTNGPSSSRTSLISFPPVAFRLPSKTAYRSVAPPLQNGPASLGSVLVRGMLITPSSTP